MKNTLTMCFLTLVPLWTFVTPSCSQATGTVEYKYLGLRFTIPDGWIGQENEIGYLVGSYTEPGFALLTTNPSKSLDQLRQQAQQGIYDQNGTVLNPAGQLETIGQNALGGEFHGTLEGQQVKAFLAGIINTHGDGVTIMVAAAPHEFSSTHRTLALDLIQSMQFFEAETAPIVEEWRQRLQNAKLTSMDSYYSSGSGVDVGGTVYSSGGGYNNKVEIHLCGQGFFKYKSSSSVSVDQGAFGSSQNAGQGSGSWSVIGNSEGGAVLRLSFHNGETFEYTLTYTNNQTLLNGKRYYRTYASEGAEFGPECW